MLLPRFCLPLFLHLDGKDWFDFISYARVPYSPLMYFYTFSVWSDRRQEWGRVWGTYQFIMYRFRRYGYFFNRC